MNFIDFVLLFSVIIFGIIMLYFYLKMKHPVKNLLLNTLICWAVWGVVNNTTFLTGFYIPLNWYTFIGCSAYGIPGMVGFITLSTIFGL